jgi:hypothetical protein
MSCREKLTSFADFKRDVKEKHRVVETETQELERIDFISLGLDGIKQEILEPDYVSDSYENDSEIFVCTEENCCREFPIKRSLIGHKNRVHSHGEKFWCRKCDRVFKTKKEMVRCSKHHFTDLKEKAFKCPERDCSNSFPSQSLMISHRNKFHGTSIFYCKTCNISYNSKAELVRCQKLHYANKIAGVYINCPKCDKRLKKFSLHLHLKFFHEKKRDHQCQVRVLKIKRYN